MTRHILPNNIYIYALPNILLHLSPYKSLTRPIPSLSLSLTATHRWTLFKFPLYPLYDLYTNFLLLLLLLLLLLIFFPLGVNLKIKDNLDELTLLDSI